MSETEALSPQLKDAVGADPDVLFAYLFGSTVKDRTRPSGDVDVAVHFGTGRGRSEEAAEGGPERARIAEHALDLEGRLEALLGRAVQVVVLDHASPELVQNVLGHGRLLFSRDERARVRFYVEAGRRIYDRAHAREIFRRYRERRIREGTFGGRSGDG